MAVQCPSGPHFHINAEMALVEIVDEDGRPSAAGEMGRIIVTPFFNWAQPLIRYEQGDLAIAGATCSCGRSLPVIERIAGRAMHLFLAPDGRRILPTIPLSLGEMLGARFWQLAQTGKHTVQVRYVARDGSMPRDEDAVRNLVHDGTGRVFEVELRRVSDLPRGPGGKYLDYVNEYVPSS